MKFNLKSVRENAGFTQTDIANAVKKDLKTIWNWEKEKSYPNADQIWIIAEMCNSSPNEILGWAEEGEMRAANQDERDLLENFRSCTPERQDRLIDTARDSAAISKDTAEHSDFSSSQATV